jgi:hypothetical protein
MFHFTCPCFVWFFGWSHVVKTRANCSHVFMHTWINYTCIIWKTAWSQDMWVKIHMWISSCVLASGGFVCSNVHVFQPHTNPKTRQSVETHESRCVFHICFSCMWLLKNTCQPGNTNHHVAFSNVIVNLRHAIFWFTCGWKTWNSQMWKKTHGVVYLNVHVHVFSSKCENTRIHICYFSLVFGALHFRIHVCFEDMKQSMWKTGGFVFNSHIRIRTPHVNVTTHECTCFFQM